MKTRGLSILQILAFLGVMGVLASFIMVPNYIRARARGQLTACISNVKNIGTACEMYATDSNEVYPKSLGELTPNYLKTIPDCPYAESDTYSKSYRVETMRVDEVVCKAHQDQDSNECSTKRTALGKELASRESPAEPGEINPTELLCPQGGSYEYTAYRPVYKFHCQGENHGSTSVPPNYPQYNGFEGLVER